MDCSEPQWENFGCALSVIDTFPAPGKRILLSWLRWSTLLKSKAGQKVPDKARFCWAITICQAWDLLFKISWVWQGWGRSNPGLGQLLGHSSSGLFPAVLVNIPGGLWSCFAAKLKKKKQTKRHLPRTQSKLEMSEQRKKGKETLWTLLFKAAVLKSNYNQMK